MDHALRSLYSAGPKTAVYYTKDMFVNLRMRLKLSEPPKLLTERFMLESMVFSFHPDHFLYEVIDRKLQQYIEADLINYNVQAFKENNNPKKYKEYEEPFAVLTLEELEAGFVVCLLPFVLSFFVFAIEWTPTLKNLILFLFIFRTLFEVKRLEQKNHAELMKVRIAAVKAMLQKNYNTADKSK